jgi:hypothetical protein
MRARHEQSQLQELPAVQRQLRHLTLIDHLADRRVADMEQRNRGAHFDLLGEATCS